MTKVRIVFTRKIATSRQYWINKVSLVHWKWICKYIILFGFSCSIFWYITLKKLLTSCGSKSHDFTLIIFDFFFHEISAEVNIEMKLSRDWFNQMRSKFGFIGFRSCWTRWEYQIQNLKFIECFLYGKILDGLMDPLLSITFMA